MSWIPDPNWYFPNLWRSTSRLKLWTQIGHLNKLERRETFPAAHPKHQNCKEFLTEYYKFFRSLLELHVNDLWWSISGRIHYMVYLPIHSIHKNQLCMDRQICRSSHGSVMGIWAFFQLWISPSSKRKAPFGCSKNNGTPKWMVYKEKPY